jgi:single-strand DNA-binding protein
MNSLIISGMLLEQPQQKSVGDDQSIAEAWVEIQSVKGEEKSNKIRISAWNITGETLMQYNVGDCLLLQGSLAMRTVEREAGYKEKLAEMTVADVQCIIAVP